MALTRTPLYAGIQLNDTNNTPNATVVRGSDGSINVGATNTTFLNSSGGINLGVKVISGVATLDNSAALITVDGTSSAYVLNLPVASASTGFWYRIVQKNGAHTVTITSNGSDNILTSAGTSATTYALSATGQHVEIWCDGTQWYLKA